MSSKIAYVIHIAYPDYKSPRVEINYGTICERNMKDFFVKEVTKFIYEITNPKNITSPKDITLFWDNYYSEHYLGNSPWNVDIFINGQWESAMPSDKQIYKCYCKMKAEYEAESDKKMI